MLLSNFIKDVLTKAINAGVTGEITFDIPVVIFRFHDPFSEEIMVCDEGNQFSNRIKFSISVSNKHASDKQSHLST